jgi:hypothetical protein
MEFPDRVVPYTILIVRGIEVRFATRRKYKQHIDNNGILLTYKHMCSET